jgi:hypothetical protein
MLHFDVTRGEDSTGVALRKTTKNRASVIIAKVEGHPYNLSRKFPELFNDKGVLHSKTDERFDFLMGHNRSATIGVVNSTNAHPFHHGDITGCHNGTIHVGLLSLPKGEEIIGNTDSEKVIYALSKGWTIKKIMDTVTGAAALTWWDSSVKTFNLYRNKERPLFYTHNDANTVFAYASEDWILRLALTKGKLPEYIKNIKEFPVDQHLEIALEENKVVSAHWTNVEPYTYKPPAVTNYGNDYYKSNRSADKLRNHKLPTYLKEVKTTETFRTDSGWLDIKDLEKKEFNNLAKFGCSHCSIDLDYEDYTQGFVKWLQPDTPVCKSCANEFKYSN